MQVVSRGIDQRSQTHHWLARYASLPQVSIMAFEFYAIQMIFTENAKIWLL